ncbi:hypothetical protein CHU98_g6810 [Xylaria longipes]|nr:hypothetical protein CHU98_g6810 [Xylaria longipes]
MALQAKRWGRARPTSMENEADASGIGRHDKGRDEDTSRVLAHEERISGLDQQLNIMQNFIDDSLTRNKKLDKTKVISNKGRHRE